MPTQNIIPSSEVLDVLVVGAGPTGLALAGDLLRHGMKVRLIDRAHEPTNLSKAVVLMPRTLEEFAARGLAEEAIRLGEKTTSLTTYCQGHVIFHSEYDKLSTDYSFLVNIPQASTESVLRGYVNRYGGEVEWDTDLLSFEEDADGICATLRRPDGSTELVRAHYLTGCDGAHSIVRHTLGFEFHGAAYHDTWLLADVKIDWRLPHGHTYLFFIENGLFSVFPMPDGRYRIYVVEPLKEKLGRSPTLEEFQVIADRFVNDGCMLSDPHWLAEFHCHHRKVKHYSRGRVHLAGDAAHVHSPETGLGMNTGIQDAFNLAWKIAWVGKGLAGEDLLQSYDAERSFVGQQVVALSDFTHKVWAQFGTLAATIREPMWRFFNNYYAHHSEKLEEAMQIRIHYPASRHVVSHGQPEHSHTTVKPVEAGMRLVNGQVQPAAGSCAEATDLFSLLDASKFRLLIFTGSHPRDQAVEDIKVLLEIARPHAVYLQPLLIYGGQDASAFSELTPELFIDPTLDLHFQYAAQKGATYIVRPDLYVGYNAYGFEAKYLQQYLATLFDAGQAAQPRRPVSLITGLLEQANRHGMPLPAFVARH